MFCFAGGLCGERHWGGLQWFFFFFFFRALWVLNCGVRWGQCFCDLLDHVWWDSCMVTERKRDNWIQYRDVLRCDGAGKQHVVPLGAGRGPPFFKEIPEQWMSNTSPQHSRLLQTGFSAPHLREAVILNWTSAVSVPSFYCSTVSPCWSLMNRFLDRILLFYMQQLKLHKGTSLVCFCCWGNVLCKRVLMVPLTRRCSYVFFCGFVMPW